MTEKQDMGVVTPLPCPFCKWELYAGTLDDGSTCTSVEDGVFWIECPDCFAQGPLEGSEAEAIAAWNHRLASQADQGCETTCGDALKKARAVYWQYMEETAEAKGDTMAVGEKERVFSGAADSQHGVQIALRAIFATHPQPSQKGEGDE